MSKLHRTCIWCENDKSEGKFAEDSTICEMCLDFVRKLRKYYVGTTPINKLAIAASKEAWKNKMLKINGW